MDILGSIGKLYTFTLLVVLFLGSGLAAWAGINAIINKKDKIKENTDKIKGNLSSKLKGMKNINIIGGINMKNNGFIKLAVFSFVGIIISAAILTALPKFNNPGNNMNMNPQYNTSPMNMQGNMYGQSNMQGNMYGQSNMQSNIYGQSNMQNMSGNPMQGAMNYNVDVYSIQQQLNYIQQQIYQLQNQMNNSSMSNMQNNSGSGMNSMNNMSGMNSMNNNSNMGNNNSMNNNMNNNMNNSNSNSNSNSMSSMPMM